MTAASNYREHFGAWRERMPRQMREDSGTYWLKWSQNRPGASLGTRTTDWPWTHYERASADAWGRLGDRGRA